MTPSLSEMVTDGANRVGPRREATPQAVTGFALSVMLTVVVLRSRRGPALLGAASVAIIASALPGLSTLAERRADSPAKATLAAAEIERFQGDVESFADAHGCAVVAKSACLACDPIVDFALATSRACSAPAPIVLGAEALTAGCVESRGTLTCGAGARP